jgi:peroxiredoxin Q/BCP
MVRTVDAFILSSPLQALNAIEARKAFESSQCAAVVVESLCAKSNEQIWSVVREVAWDHVAVIGMRHTPLYSRYVDVDRAVSLLREVGAKRIFMGHHFDLGLHLVNAVPHRETYLMDDGVATISVCLTRTRGEPVFRYNRPALHWSPAPDFTDDAGRSVSLSALRGRNVVLVFYPGDDTPGCTKQLCDLRDHWEQARSRNVEVFGVNPAGAEKHERFRRKFSFPFPLVADRGQRIAKLYHANGLIIKRTVYVIGPDGVIRFARRGMPSPSEVLAAAR